MSTLKKIVKTYLVDHVNFTNFSKNAIFFEKLVKTIDLFTLTLTPRQFDKFFSIKKIFSGKLAKLLISLHLLGLLCSPRQFHDFFYAK